MNLKNIALAFILVCAAFVLGYFQGLHYAAPGATLYFGNRSSDLRFEEAKFLYAYKCNELAKQLSLRYASSTDTIEPYWCE